MMNKKTSIVLIIAIIVIIVVGISSFLLLNNNSDKNETIVNNTTVVENITNITEDVQTSSSSVAHGYCAICGAPLSASEASNEYTQGKVCLSCAKNPYYQTGPGAEYANQKLEEAYPEDYNGIADDKSY